VNQRVPASIRPLLDDYVSLVNQHLPDLLRAFYLEGSIALGGFNERFSDIDFVAMLRRRINPSDIEALRHIHQVVEKNDPRWKLSGSYLPSDALDCPDEFKSHPYYRSGVLRLTRQFAWQSVEGWILKNHGIAVIGPEPQGLPFTVDWDLLIAKMVENLNSYWASWTKRPDGFIVMLSDWGIQWTVLGVLRQFYSFRENTITTKTKAGEYALTCLPIRWHPLVQEAIDIREGKKRSAHRFRIVRAIEAVRFLKYIIQTCNLMPASGSATF
jgi:hypothetical protein